MVNKCYVLILKYKNRTFFHKFLEITTTKSVILIAKITQKKCNPGGTVYKKR